VKLSPAEILLTERFVLVDDHLTRDGTGERIEVLINSYLQRLTSASDGWDTLYCDPADGRFWELVYPESHMHGGGPRELRCLATDQAATKYGEGFVLKRRCAGK